MQTDDTEYKAPCDLAALKRKVEHYLEQTRTNAELCKKDRDYYDGKQISPAIAAKLEKRGQPPAYINKIAPAINGLFGIMDAASSDPEALPRSANAQDAADIATKTLRYLSDRAELPKVRRECSAYYLLQGTAAAILEFDGEVTVSAIAWQDLIFDPLSIKHDFSDAKFLGVAKLMDLDDAKALFPAFQDGLMGGEDFFDFHDEDLKAKWWATKDRRRVRVVDLYYKVGGDWHRATFTAGQLLHAGPSEYQDDQGNTICPIEAVSFEVSREGDRYGAVRHMIPLQDSVNLRSSRLLHLVNHRQVRQAALNAPAQNKEIARREAAKADGVIPFGYEPISAPDLAQGQMLLLQQANADLERMAPTPAVLGRSGGVSESGRARQILQQAGLTELARAFNRFEAFELGLYRKMWLAARQYLTEPKWIRINADPRAIEFLQINEPVNATVPQPVTNPETGEPMIDPFTGMAAMMPVEMQVGTNNAIAELDMDIILTTVPDTVTLEQETWQSILEYAGSTGISPFDPNFLALLEMSPLANKNETIEKIKRLASENAGHPNPLAQQMGHIDLAKGQAKVKQTEAKAAKDFAMAHKTQVDVFRAGLGMPNVGFDAPY